MEIKLLSKIHEFNPLETSRSKTLETLTLHVNRLFELSGEEHKSLTIILTELHGLAKSQEKALKIEKQIKELNAS